MPGFVRLGDMCTGHGPWPPRNAISACSKVTVQGKLAHRVGDGWSVHCKPGSNPACHGASQASGSSKITVQGKAQALVGKSISCGSSNATGSSKVTGGG